jgi:hypothetical protein
LAENLKLLVDYRDQLVSERTEWLTGCTPT